MGRGKKNKDEGKTINDADKDYGVSSPYTERRDLFVERYEVPEEFRNQQNFHNSVKSQSTPHQINISIANSALQGACRQGRFLEAWQWALEMARGGNNSDYPGFPTQFKSTASFTNLWTRLIIYTAEDIGFGNPCMIIAASALLDKDGQQFKIFQTRQEAEIEVMQFVKYVCASPKSRSTDHAAMCRFPTAERFDDLLFFQKMAQALINGDYAQSIAYGEDLLIQGYFRSKANVKNSYSKFTRSIFDNAWPGQNDVAFADNTGVLSWLAIFFALRYLQRQENQAYPSVEAILKANYNIMTKRFPFKQEGRLFQRFCIVDILDRKRVEERGLKFIPAEPDNEYWNWTQAQMEAYRVRLRDQGNLYGIPDSAYDQHTGIGKNRGREMKHFIQIKSRLRHDLPEHKELSRNFLTALLQVRYQKDTSWLPGMFAEHDQMEQYEMLVEKHPHVLYLRFTNSSNMNSQWAQAVKTGLYNPSRDGNGLQLKSKEYQNEKGKQVLEVFKLLTAYPQTRMGFIEMHRATYEETMKNYLTSNLLNSMKQMFQTEIVESTQDEANVFIYLKEDLDHQYGNVAFMY